jgi:hypothetical protein
MTNAAFIEFLSLTFLQGDAHALDFPDGSFDLVCASTRRVPHSIARGRRSRVFSLLWAETG